MLQILTYLLQCLAIFYTFATVDVRMFFAFEIKGKDDSIPIPDNIPNCRKKILLV